MKRLVIRLGAVNWARVGRQQLHRRRAGPVQPGCRLCIEMQFADVAAPAEIAVEIVEVEDCRSRQPSWAMPLAAT